MKRQSWILLLVFTAFIFTGLVWAAKDTKKPYVIGVFCSVTGPNAPLGTPERDTLLMLEEQINKKGGINGYPLKLIIADDGSDNTNAVKSAKKLIEQDGVCAIIGSSGTGPTMAVIPITEAGEIPHMSMAAGIAITNPLKKWVFRTPQTDVLAIGRILDYLTSKKINKVAMIYDSNAYGSSGRDQLRVLAPQYNVTIVAEEAFSTKDTDMTVQLTKIRSTDAQAIICWGTNPAPAQVAKNLKQLGINLPLFMSHGVANKAFLDQAGDAANGVLLPAGKLIIAKDLPSSDPQRKQLIEYTKQFEAKYGRPVDTFGGHAWDALSILVHALKKVNASYDDQVAFRTNLRDEIEKTTKFAGIGGVFNYSATNHDGLSNDAFVMVEVKNGNWSLVKKK
jgi:branched-chain amino acid transport system substrate-binding protein